MNIDLGNIRSWLPLNCLASQHAEVRQVDFIALLPAAIRLACSRKKDGQSFDATLNLLEQFWTAVRQQKADYSAISDQVEAGYEAKYQAAVDLLHDSRLAKNSGLRKKLLLAALDKFIEMSNNSTNPLRQLRAKGSIVVCYHLLEEPALAEKRDKERKEFASRLAQKLRTDFSVASRRTYIERATADDAEEKRNSFIASLTLDFDILLYLWDGLSGAEDRRKENRLRIELSLKEAEGLIE